jgi:hypothetical protein
VRRDEDPFSLGHLLKSHRDRPEGLHGRSPGWPEEDETFRVRGSPFLALHLSSGFGEHNAHLRPIRRWRRWTRDGRGGTPSGRTVKHYAQKCWRGFTIVVADTEQKEGLSSAHAMEALRGCNFAHSADSWPILVIVGRGIRGIRWAAHRHPWGRSSAGGKRQAPRCARRRPDGIAPLAHLNTAVGHQTS